MQTPKVKALKAFPVNSFFTYAYICPKCDRQTNISTFDTLGRWSTKFCAFCGLKLLVLLSNNAKPEL